MKKTTKRNKNIQAPSKKQRKASRFYSQVVRDNWKRGQMNNDRMNRARARFD